MECRPASAEDSDRVAELLEQLGYPATPEATRHRLQGLAASHNDEVVVDETARRQGIGKQLMALAEREARRRGCVLLFLTTAERRQDAHAFYRGLGFDETGRRFAKPLDWTGSQ